MPERVQTTWIEEVTTEFLASSLRYCIHQGGSRSGKTYNIAMALLMYVLMNPNITLSIVRATSPALKATVQKDVIEILTRFGVYSEAIHNKTENIIKLSNGSVIEFFSVDDEQKVRGRKRDLLWINEANEVSADRWLQLKLRTTGKIILDFNPSMQEHWIWSELEAETQAEWHTSTYKDNPFAPAEVVREIEKLEHTDDYGWQVYGLGKRGVAPNAIYRNVQVLTEFPDDLPFVYGLDFGFNDPMVLLKVAWQDSNPPVRHKPRLYIWSLLHESYLTTQDLIAKLPELGVSKESFIYCDNAEPDRIQELRRAGYQAREADKRGGSRRAGISYCQSHELLVGGPAVERAKAELRGYRFKVDGNGRTLDEPIEKHDHAPDTMRYAAYTHFASKTEYHPPIVQRISRR